MIMKAFIYYSCCTEKSKPHIFSSFLLYAIVNSDRYQLNFHFYILRFTDVMWPSGGSRTKCKFRIVYLMVSEVVAVVVLQKH